MAQTQENASCWQTLSLPPDTRIYRQDNEPFYYFILFTFWGVMIPPWALQRNTVCLGMIQHTRCIMTGSLAKMQTESPTKVETVSISFLFTVTVSSRTNKIKLQYHKFILHLNQRNAHDLSQYHSHTHRHTHTHTHTYTHKLLIAWYNLDYNINSPIQSGFQWQSYWLVSQEKTISTATVLSHSGKGSFDSELSEKVTVMCKISSCFSTSVFRNTESIVDNIQLTH